MAIQTSMEAIEAMPLFAAARRAGEAAGQACAEKAERTTAFSAEVARAAVLELLADGVARSGEQLVDACQRRGLVPHDARAFGAVFGKLKRDGLIEEVGYVSRTKGHGTSGGRMWRATKRTSTTF